MVAQTLLLGIAVAIVTCSAQPFHRPDVASSSSASSWPMARQRWSTALPFDVDSFGDPIIAGNALIQVATLPPHLAASPSLEHGTFNGTFINPRRGDRDSAPLAAEASIGAASSMGANTVNVLTFHRLPQADLSDVNAKSDFERSIAAERRASLEADVVAETMSGHPKPQRLSEPSPQKQHSSRRLSKPKTSHETTKSVNEHTVGAANGTSVVLIFNAQTGTLDRIVTIPGRGLYVSGLSSQAVFNAVSTAGVFSMAYRTNGTLEKRWHYSPSALNRTSAFPSWPGKCVTSASIWCTWYNTPMVSLDPWSGRVKFTTTWFAGSRLWLNLEDWSIMTTKVYAEEAIGRDRVVSVVKASGTTGEIQWSYAVNPRFAKVAARRGVIAVKEYGATPTSPVNLASLDAASGAVNWVKTSDTEFDFNVANGLIYQTVLPPRTGDDHAAKTEHNANDFDDKTSGVDSERRLQTLTVSSKSDSGVGRTTGITFKAFMGTSGMLLWSTTMPTSDPSSNCVAFPNQPVVVLQAFATGANYAVEAFSGKPAWRTVGAAPMYGVAKTPLYCFGSGRRNVTCVDQAV